MGLIYYLAFTFCAEPTECNRLLGIKHPFTTLEECEAVRKSAMQRVKGDDRYRKFKCVAYGPLTEV